MFLVKIVYSPPLIGVLDPIRVRRARIPSASLLLRGPTATLLGAHARADTSSAGVDDHHLHGGTGGRGRAHSGCRKAKLWWSTRAVAHARHLFERMSRSLNHGMLVRWHFISLLPSCLVSCALDCEFELVVLFAYSATILAMKLSTTMNNKFFYLGGLILVTFFLFGFWYRLTNHYPCKETRTRASTKLEGGVSALSGASWGRADCATVQGSKFIAIYVYTK